MRDQRQVDTDHLKLLSVFHFVGAGLALVGLLFLAAHYAVFHAFFAEPEKWPVPKAGGVPPAEFFSIFKWFYLVAAIWFIGSGVLNLMSGLYLQARKHRTFSIFTAAVNCLHMPLGTVLGVLTIVVLLRDTIRESYEAQP